MEKIMRIIIADNQAMVRSALRLLLDQQRGTLVVGEATSEGELEGMLQRVATDLVILEWELSVAPAALIQRLRPLAKVIVLSRQPETRRLALEAGADAFLSKGDPPDAVKSVVRQFLPGHAGRM